MLVSNVTFMYERVSNFEIDENAKETRIYLMAFIIIIGFHILK